MKMPLRIAVLVAVVMAATAAVAEPDALQKLHRWLWPNAPRQERVIIQPLPDMPPAREIAPAPSPESTVALPKSRPIVVERQPRPKAKPKPVVSPITCAQARRGVGMPCFMIRANAWQYKQLSPAQKRHADNCLSAQEREAIKACFH